MKTEEFTPEENLDDSPFEEFTVTSENVISLMASLSADYTYPADFLHITHKLLHALDLADNYDTVKSYHIARKVKKLSLQIEEDLSKEQIELILKDDEKERKEKNGRIEYFDSTREKGLPEILDLVSFINNDLYKFFTKHKDLSKEAKHNIRACSIGVLVDVASRFGYNISINSD